MPIMIDRRFRLYPTYCVIEYTKKEKGYNTHHKISFGKSRKPINSYYLILERVAENEKEFTYRKEFLKLSEHTAESIQLVMEYLL
jgi:hypothetical protein